MFRKSLLFARKVAWLALRAVRIRSPKSRRPLFLVGSLILTALVGAAIPAPKKVDTAVRKPVVTYHGFGTPFMMSAATFTRQADQIVVGQVDSIHRADYTPTGDSSMVMTFAPVTVYNFEVEQTLKGSLMTGQTVKVLSQGATINGDAYVLEGDPTLKVGSRYIVFLHTPSSVETSVGTGGLMYPYRSLDELSLQGGAYSKIELVGGQALPASDNYTTALVEAFIEGSQIFTLGGNAISESQSIANINQAIIDATVLYN